MIGPNDIQSWAESLYDDFLRSIIDDRDYFQPPPRRERLGRVQASEAPTTFAASVSPLWDSSKQVRGFGYTVVLESRQRRSRGLQNEPVAVEIQTSEDYLALLQKDSEVRSFRDDLSYIIGRFPGVRDVLRLRPRLIVTNHGAWAGIAEVVEYLNVHPRPECFVRALPVSVNTKFIEAHEAAIEALLSAIPGAGYDSLGLSFESRCGFKQDEPSIRGRFLCGRLQAALGFPTPEVELRVSTWASLSVSACIRVIACENKTNFLALPAMEWTLALWGAGGAATGHFPRVRWLAKVPFVYWGDLDPCGFVILASLRESFPDVRSVLMDTTTLSAHRDVIGDAKPSPNRIRVERLKPEEAEVALELQESFKGIEQEKLLFRDCLRAVHAAFD